MKSINLNAAITLILTLTVTIPIQAESNVNNIPIGLYSDSTIPLDSSLLSTKPWLNKQSGPARAAAKSRESMKQLTYLKKQLNELTEQLNKSLLLVKQLQEQQKNDVIQQSVLKVQLTQLQQDNTVIETQLKQKLAQMEKGKLLWQQKHEEQQNVNIKLKEQLTHVLKEKNDLISQIKTDQAHQVALITHDERTAYAAGQNYSHMLMKTLAMQKNLGVTLSHDALLMGVVDGLQHRNKLSAKELASLTDTLDANLNEHLQKQQKLRQANNIAQGKAGLAFYAKFEKENGVHHVSGGKSLYQIKKTGSGEKVKESDSVDILLTGRLPDGNVFDSSGREGHIQRVNANSILPGLTNGLTQVAKGGILTVVLPPEEGFGADGIPPFIPGNATLIFDIEVKDVHSKKT